MAPVQHDRLPYILQRPTRVIAPVVFSSPHSGRDYPEGMIRRSILDERRLRSSEDAFVDDLLASAPARGAALLAARYPRAYVDLNRAEDELDPALIEGLLRPPRGARVMAGLGVIPRVVAGNRPIYAGKLPRAEAEARLATVWRPYHAVLAALLGEMRHRFGRVILFDMHSMPSEAVDQMGERRPDIVLGDRFGVAARSETTAQVDAVFSSLGLRVARNAPFAGAYVAQAYGRPAQGVNVIQVEIDRALYLDEARVRPSGDFEAFRALMDGIVARVAGIDADGGLALAAE